MVINLSTMNQQLSTYFSTRLHGRFEQFNLGVITFGYTLINTLYYYDYYFLNRNILYS
jgi:hypothetical protein